jgi:hypothetical protein
MVLFKENQLDGFEWRVDQRPIYPEWVLAHIAASEGRLDTIRLGLDSLLLTMEDIEYGIYNLSEDSVLRKFIQQLAAVGSEPEGNHRV